MPSPYEASPPEHKSFPDLSFGFNFDQQFMAHQPIESPEGVVREVTRALCSAMGEKLPREDYPDVFRHYSYSEAKLKRADKYMATAVTGSRGRMRRRDIVDVSVATVRVLDEIALVNHPVAQAVAQLQQDYGERIGDVGLDYVATSLIKLTHWDKLRSEIANQVNGWRLGRMAVN